MFGCYFCSTAPTLISPMRRAKLCPTCCHLASNVFKKVSLNCLVVMVREVRKHQLSYAAIVPTALVDRQFWSFTLHIVYVSFCLWQFRFFGKWINPGKHMNTCKTDILSWFPSVLTVGWVSDRKGIVKIKMGATYPQTFRSWTTPERKPRGTGHRLTQIRPENGCYNRNGA